METISDKSKINIDKNIPKAEEIVSEEQDKAKQALIFEASKLLKARIIAPNQSNHGLF